MTDQVFKLIEVGQFAGWYEVDKSTWVDMIKKQSVSEAFQDAAINPVRYYVKL